MIIEIKNPWKSYGRVTALKGISLKIDEGEKIVIVGENGSGRLPF